MKRSERTYDQMFGLLRDTPPATSFTTEEIESLIERSAGDETSHAPDIAPMYTSRRIAIAVILLAVAVAGVSFFVTADPPRDRVTETVRQADGRWGAGTSGAPARTGGAPAATAAAVAPPAATIPARPHAMASVPSDRRRLPVAPRSDRPNVIATRQTPPERASSDTMEIPRSLAQNPPDVTTIPMLELSPEELKSLGVTFTGGRLETACEEYYTLASEQDRTTFARMGLDTTKRSGIIRMRLSIDTLDPAPRMSERTRVDDYSRIAPVVVLSSPVRDDRNNTVFVASFKHSPIMASARRSIDSMVTFLPEALASGNGDRVMHDSDQANPARILVPVHVRLGEAPANGGAKRRGADIILWYYPTAEFTAALPARYRTSLQRELNVLADVVECNLPQREACRQLTGEPLLVNYCRRTSGALSGLNVSPNPAHGNVRVRYMLEAQRTVRIALYGIRGEFVREVAGAATHPSGMQSESVQLDGVRPGAYMIVLRSDQGEQVSERLIVQ